MPLKKHHISTLLSGLLVLFVVSLVLSGLLGQPILIGYVETDSMSPALDPGDGFVAIPAELSGEIHENDVVVFQAEFLHGGGLVTHRVVGETDSGYITKGDANPIADQSGRGEPPVQNEQIVAKALQINGQLVVLPNLGALVETIQGVVEGTQLRLAGLFGTRLFLGAHGIAILSSILLFFVYIGLTLQETAQRPGREYERDSTRSTGMSSHVFVVAIILMLVTATTLGMVLPSTTHELEAITSDSETVTLNVDNAGFLPVVVHFESNSGSITVDPQRLYVPSQSSQEAKVVLPPPESADDMRRYLDERRYFALLPQPILTTLYRFHPWAPILVIDALIAVPFYLLGIGLLGTGRIRNRSRDRELPVLTRVRRMFRELY
ncbi:signal peptidase I [Natronomonas salsuginis]|uniref:Signal peptidase I n=1 Tax=Natronomonas salsuginis TaxID=2217661 RepID=A0A4U5JDM9_9EURY|nr:signal peptidase I [Natronomonas salsuginis]TKR25737.1 signal peptidase I [Natronomonas salsuginis]